MSTTAASLATSSRASHRRPAAGEIDDAAGARCVSSARPAIRASARGAGTLITVLAKPGARVPNITEIASDYVGVAIDAEPRDGKANAALCELLAQVLGVRARTVVLTHGGKGRLKTFEVADLSADVVQVRLQEACAQSAEGRLLSRR